MAAKGAMAHARWLSVADRTRRAGGRRDIGGVATVTTSALDCVRWVADKLICARMHELTAELLGEIGRVRHERPDYCLPLGTQVDFEEIAHYSSDKRAAYERCLSAVRALWPEVERAWWQRPTLERELSEARSRGDVDGAKRLARGMEAAK